jgi:hypothetical protein
VILAAFVVLGGGALAAQQVFATPPHDHGAHSHAPDLDPCTLVTEAEAEAIIGPVLPPTSGGMTVVSDQVVCQMTLEGDTRFSANIGFANFDVDGKFRGFAQRFPAVTDAVPDLGDEAVWVETFRIVLVKADGELITVQLSDVFADPAVVKDQAVRLARVALEGAG